MGGFRKLRRDQAGFRRFFAYLEETGLDEPLREICRAHRTTLYETYTDGRGPALHAARLECWGWLVLEAGRSASEVARLYERDPTSVLYGLRRLREIDTENGVALARDTLRPLARRVAAKSAEAMAAGARRPKRRRTPSRLPQDRVSGSEPPSVASESETGL